jgi:hypothetical protein
MKKHSLQTAHGTLMSYAGRRLFTGFALVAISISATLCLGAEKMPATLDDIAAAHQLRRQSVESFLVEYELRAKALADMKVLHEYLGTGYLLNEDHTFAAMDDLRYFHYVGHYEVKKGVVSNPTERTVVYEGGKVTKERRTTRRGGPELVMVEAVRKHDFLNFPIYYTGAACFAFPDPSEKEPGSVTGRHHIPEMFKRATFAVAPRTEAIDGSECVVIEAIGEQKLWLDPQKGYAVRKREFYKDGNHTRTIYCRELVEVTPALWLPRQVSLFDLAPKLASAEYRGKALLQTDIRVRQLEANRKDHEALFRLKIPPGIQVIDETLTGHDPLQIPYEAGRKSPAVAYRQPANEADLGVVIDKAQKAYEAQEARARWRFIMITINVIVITMVVSVLAWWWFKRRRRAKAILARGNEA